MNNPAIIVPPSFSRGYYYCYFEKVSREYSVKCLRKYDISREQRDGKMKKRTSATLAVVFFLSFRL